MKKLKRKQWKAKEKTRRNGNEEKGKIYNWKTNTLRIAGKKGKAITWKKSSRGE